MESDHVMLYGSDTRHSQMATGKKKKGEGGKLGDLWLVQSEKWVSFYCLKSLQTRARMGDEALLTLHWWLMGHFPVYVLYNNKGSRSKKKSIPQPSSWKRRPPLGTLIYCIYFCASAAERLFPRIMNGGPYVTQDPRMNKNTGISGNLTKLILKCHRLFCCFYF